MRPEPPSSLEEAIGYRFQRSDLLERALTHSSHAHELGPREDDGASADNEQLEFLGDAVLGFVASQALLKRFPQYHEGQLSKMRAHLVSAQHLVVVAKRLELGKYLHLGRGEEKSGGRTKAALLSDALEALVAAVYLDGGLARVRRFVLKNIVEPEVTRLQAQAGAGFPVTDSKSTLQELLQARGNRQPDYRVVTEKGPEHEKTFTVELRIHTGEGNGRPDFVARGEGRSKKTAEQHAAHQALEHLKSLPKGDRRRHIEEG
jgi:ribonuclease III